MSDKLRDTTDALTKSLVDKGLLIEAGFASYVIACFGSHDKVPTAQLREMRQCFFGGAQHLFGSITGSILDDDAEPTDADMRRIELIDAELKKFISEFARDHMPTRGQA